MDANDKPAAIGRTEAIITRGVGAFVLAIVVWVMVAFMNAEKIWPF